MSEIQEQNKESKVLKKARKILESFEMTVKCCSNINSEYVEIIKDMKIVVHQNDDECFRCTVSLPETTTYITHITVWNNRVYVAGDISDLIVELHHGQYENPIYLLQLLSNRGKGYLKRKTVAGTVTDWIEVLAWSDLIRLAIEDIEYYEDGLQRLKRIVRTYDDYKYMNHSQEEFYKLIVDESLVREESEIINYGTQFSCQLIFAHEVIKHVVNHVNVKEIKEVKVNYTKNIPRTIEELELFVTKIKTKISHPLSVPTFDEIFQYKIALSRLLALLCGRKLAYVFTKLYSKSVGAELEKPVKIRVDDFNNVTVHVDLLNSEFIIFELFTFGENEQTRQYVTYTISHEKYSPSFSHGIFKFDFDALDLQ